MSTFSAKEKNQQTSRAAASLASTKGFSHNHKASPAQRKMQESADAWAQSRTNVIQAKSDAFKLPQGDQPQQLGSKMFLWRNIENTQTLMISAHGGLTKKEKQKTVTVPEDMTFISYVPHGDMLVDPGLRLAGSNEEDRPIHARAGEQVSNYTLTKFQGKGSQNAETYEHIVEKMKEGGVEHPFDVLTVRNRWWSSSVTLQDVVDQLNAMPLNPYREIHLNICKYVPADIISEDDFEMRAQDRQRQGYTMI